MGERLRGAFSPTNLTLLVLGVVLGLAIAIQWRTASLSQTSLLTYGRERTAITIAQLEDEQERLKGTIKQLREELSEYQRQAMVNKTQLSEISAELNAQRVVAGVVSVKGPGVEVLLDDSSVPVPESVDPQLLIVHEYDLRDVINALWSAGSEAVAINDERIVSTTSIYCVGSTIMVNDTRLSPPCAIRAIGDSKAQQEALLQIPYLEKLRMRAKLYGVQFKISLRNEMTLPAYTGSFAVRNLQLED